MSTVGVIRAVIGFAISANIGLVASFGTPAAAQPVPEGIHSEGDERPEVCGLRAASVPALEAQIQTRSDFETLPTTTEHYRAFAISEGMRILTFTTPSNPAHPAVVCRQVADNGNGGSTIQTTIACYNSRENCDWLYREFEALTRRMLGRMEGRE